MLTTHQSASLALTTSNVALLFGRVITLFVPITSTGLFLTIIDTVSMLIAHLSSFIVSEKTYVPLTRFDTLVLALLGVASVVVLGHDTCFRAYEAIVPSLSDDSDPSSDTVTGNETTLSAHAFALGYKLVLPVVDLFC